MFILSIVNIFIPTIFYLLKAILNLFGKVYSISSLCRYLEESNSYQEYIYCGA